MPNYTGGGIPFFDVAFAVDGIIALVPDAVQSNGTMSYTQGFTNGYQIPAGSPGYLPVPLNQTNQVFNDITTLLQYLGQNGAPPFITTAMNNGTPYSYNLGAICSYNAGSGTQNWFSTSASNTTVPGAMGAHWAVFGTSGIPNDAQTGTSYVLAATDSSQIVTRSNSGTAMADTLPGTSGALSANWFAYIENIDASAPDTVSVGGGGNISVGNAYTSSSFIISPGETWLVISLGSGNYIAMRIGAATLHTRPPQGAHKNLAGVWATNATATYTADAIVLYDSNGNSKIITSFNETLNTGTSGAGGIDTGSIGDSTWYYVYAILKPSTGTVNILISLSMTSPTLPTGYTYFSLIGAVYADSSAHLRGFTQADDLVTFKVGSNLSGLPIVATGGAGNTNTPTFVTATIRGASNLVPVNATSVLFGIYSAANDGIDVILAPNGSYGANLSITNPPPFVANNGSIGGNVAGRSVPGEMLLEGNSIYYAIGAGSGGTNQAIACYGFRMHL